jgi:hypothetical protein
MTYFVLATFIRLKLGPRIIDNREAHHMQCNTNHYWYEIQKAPGYFRNWLQSGKRRPLHNRYTAATMAEPNQAIITFLPDAKLLALPV